MTDDSGHGRKSVTFNQNGRSRSVGTTGHVQTESAVKLDRNTQNLAHRRAIETEPSGIGNPVARATTLSILFSYWAETLSTSISAGNFTRRYASLLRNSDRTPARRLIWIYCHSPLAASILACTISSCGAQTMCEIQGLPAEDRVSVNRVFYEVRSPDVRLNRIKFAMP